MRWVMMLAFCVEMDGRAGLQLGNQNSRQVVDTRTCFPGCIQSKHQDAHLLAAKQFPKLGTHDCELSRTDKAKIHVYECVSVCMSVCVCVCVGGGKGTNYKNKDGISPIMKR